MKKLILSLLLAVPFITGCSNINTNITINKDYSAKVDVIESYAGNLSNNEDTTAYNINQIYKKFLDKSYTTKDEFKNDTSIIHASKNIDSLYKEDINLSSLGYKSNLPDKKFINVNKNWIIQTVNIDMTIDLKKQSNRYKAYVKQLQNKDKKSLAGMKPEYFQKDSELLEDFKEINNQDAAGNQPTTKTTKNKIEATTTLTIPSISLFNNADVVDGNNYTWYIKQNEPTNIKLQYINYNTFHIVIAMLFLLGLLILLTYKITKHENQKRTDNINNIV